MNVEPSSTYLASTERDAMYEPEYQPPLTMDRTLDEYHFTDTQASELQADGEPKEDDKILYLGLAYNMKFELHSPQNFYAMHTRPSLPPTVNELL